MGADGELTGLVAVVTGAGSGIGRAIAVELGTRGADVVLVGRRPEALAETAVAIAAVGGSSTAVPADLRDDGVQTVAVAAPVIDLLVNNAAAYAPYLPVEGASDRDFEDVHTVVVDASRRLVQHALPGMKQRGFGRIVCVGSVAGARGGAGQAAYSIAKAALVGLVRTVAVEGAPYGVTANLVEPGLIDTDRIAGAVAPDVRERIVRAIPVGRIGEPAEVAHMVATLTSPRAGYVTGAVVPVTGGLGLGVFPAGEP